MIELYFHRRNVLTRFNLFIPFLGFASFYYSGAPSNYIAFFVGGLGGGLFIMNSYTVSCFIPGSFINLFSNGNSNDRIAVFISSRSFSSGHFCKGSITVIHRFCICRQANGTCTQIRDQQGCQNSFRVFHIIYLHSLCLSGVLSLC